MDGEIYSNSSGEVDASATPVESVPTPAESLPEADNQAGGEAPVENTPTPAPVEAPVENPAPLEGSGEGVYVPEAPGGDGAGGGSESDKSQGEQNPNPQGPIPNQIPSLNDQKETPQTINPLKSILEKCRQVIAQRKQRRLVKVLEIAQKKGKITNSDVCKALHISQSSATNYLSELEKQGRIRQVGKVGRDVFYQL